MEIVKNKPDRNRPIQITDAKQFMVSTKKAKEADTVVSVKPEAMEEALKGFNEGKNRIISYDHKPKKFELLAMSEDMISTLICDSEVMEEFLKPDYIKELRKLEELKRQLKEKKK